MHFTLHGLEDDWAQDLKDFASHKQKLIQELSPPDLEERMSKLQIENKRRTSNYGKHGRPYILIRTILRAKFHEDHIILNMPTSNRFSWCWEVKPLINKTLEDHRKQENPTIKTPYNIRTIATALNKGKK